MQPEADSFAPLRFAQNDKNVILSEAKDLLFNTALERHLKDFRGSPRKFGGNAAGRSAEHAAMGNAL
jgi:hypothetical protein